MKLFCCPHQSRQMLLEYWWSRGAFLPQLHFSWTRQQQGGERRGARRRVGSELGISISYRPTVSTLLSLFPFSLSTLSEKVSKWPLFSVLNLLLFSRLSTYTDPQHRKLPSPWECSQLFKRWRAHREYLKKKKGKIVKRSNLIQSELKFEGSNSPARLTNDFSFTFLFPILIPLPIFLPFRFYFLFNQTNLLFIFHTGSGTKDQRCVLYDSLGSARHLFSSWTSKTKRENLHNFHLFLRNGCWLWRGDGAARHPEPKAPLQLPVLIGCCTPANNGYIRLRAKNGFCIAISHCGQTSARWRREQE